MNPSQSPNISLNQKRIRNSNKNHTMQRQQLYQQGIVNLKPSRALSREDERDLIEVGYDKQVPIP